MEGVDEMGWPRRPGKSSRVVGNRSVVSDYLWRSVAGVRS